MQSGAGEGSPQANMEENGVIEALADDDLHEAGEDITSDYEPSEGGTTFGSLTSSVNDHVWEYGRCVPSRPGRVGTAAGC